MNHTNYYVWIDNDEYDKFIRILEGFAIDNFTSASSGTRTCIEFEPKSDWAVKEIKKFYDIKPINVYRFIQPNDIRSDV